MVHVYLCKFKSQENFDFPWRIKFFDDHAPRSKINLQVKSLATTHCIMSQFDWSSMLSCNTTF